MQEDIIYNLPCIIEDNRIFCFQADGVDTLLDVKKRISFKANILQNSFSIFYEGEEFEREHEAVAIKNIFHDKKVITLLILYKKLKNEEIEVNINESDIKRLCPRHKTIMNLFCFDCQKSICKICQIAFHPAHNYKKKTDYLIPSKDLADILLEDCYNLNQMKKYLIIRFVLNLDPLLKIKFFIK